MKINVLMSKYVKTRSSDQCRSHHQKMKNNHSNVLSIIECIENQEKGVIRQKIRREDSAPEQEIIPIEQPQNQREILMSRLPTPES